MPRHVLSHSGGLPNWRNADLPLKTYFEPGARFSYSGEGFLYLQKAVEAITREKLHTVVKRLVLQPLGMVRSSFIWEERFGPNRAYPHDAFGQSALGGKPGEANAASTLQTTAADFARFLLAVLDRSRLQPETARSWLRPHIEVRHARPQNVEQSASDIATGVAWGLGWGLEPANGTFFHWGDNGAYKAFTIGSMQNRNALVCFLNGASGLSIMPELIAAFMPGDHPFWPGSIMEDTMRPSVVFCVPHARRVSMQSGRRSRMRASNRTNCYGLLAEDRSEQAGKAVIQASGEFPQSGTPGNCRSCAFRCSKSTGLARKSAAPYSAACRRRSSSP